MLESASWLGAAETTGISPIRRTADHEQASKGLIAHKTIPQIIQNIWKMVALMTFNSFTISTDRTFV